MKRQPKEWEKIFANLIKISYPEYIMNSYNSTTRRQIIQFLNEWKIWLAVSSDKIDKWPINKFKKMNIICHSIQFSSLAQLCPTLCNPMNRSTQGLPVHHQLPESIQTHVHRVGEAIQPISSSVIPFSSCPQSFPASGSFQTSQLGWLAVPVCLGPKAFLDMDHFI